MKKSVKDIEVKGKTVFVRCDFNVPVNDAGEITDDNRITSAMPTVEYLISQGAKVILASHMGRPKGKPDMKYSLKVVANSISKLLGSQIIFVTDPKVVGPETKATAASLEPGQIMLLENVRFREEETKNDLTFAKELADLADIFVNDAFGTAHRAHASTAGIASYIPAVSGFLMEKEIQYFSKVLEAPERPFTAVLGGAKVGDKLLLIENMLDKVDTLIVGGGMAYTFIKSMGHEIGTSLLEEDKVSLTKSLIEKAESKNVKFLLPVDIITAAEFNNDSPAHTHTIDSIPADEMGLDIGPETRKLFTDAILASKTVVWNGPMGVFEMENFSGGTKAVAKALNDCNGTTIVGGGDSAAAVKQFKLDYDISHISTGGGASLEFLEGKTLPGVAVLQDK